MVNKYPAKCSICGNLVPVNGGTLTKTGRKWKVTHLECQKNGKPMVNSYYFPNTGNTVYQNARGRCEDAPCCGCCS